MNPAPRFPRQARWAVPFGAVAIVGVVAAGSVLTGARAAPALPARTPAQLIAAIAADSSLPPLSGVITSDAALGLPDLPAAGGAAPITSLLAGSRTTEIWYGGPGQLRLAVPVPLGETDLRADGRQVWLWDSQTNTATHVELPAGPPLAAPGPASSFDPGASFYSGSKAHSSTAYYSSSSHSSSQAYQSTLTVNGPTPQQAAQRLLAMLGPTTTVSAASNVMVAGQPAYQLVLAPKNPGSLIGRVSIAVDASRYLPLRVQVFARGAASPAYQAGYTSISFARPAESNFAFTPPPGARVKTIKVPAGPGLAGPLGALSADIGGGSIYSQAGMAPSQNGAPTSSVSVAPGLPTGNNAKRLAGLPKGSVAVHSLQASRVHSGAGRHGAGWYAYAPTTGGTFPPGAASAPGVIGTGWMSVAVFPAAGLTAGLAGGGAGALLRAATPVHGSWGSGRLLRTSLLSVLIMSNGQVLIGAVAPSVLYAAASQAK